MPALRPALTLFDLTGPGHRVVSRVSESRCRWVAQDAFTRDVLSAATLTIGGEMPALCAASGVTARVRRVLERAGIALPPAIETYRDAGDYLSRLDEFTRHGRVCMQRVHAPEEVEASRYRVPPEVLAWLNDKGNLAALVPEEAVPSRRVLDAELVWREPPPLPCVLKVSTAETTGGGRAVAICRDGDDLARAKERFAGAERLVVEEYLEIERSVCLSFGLFANGEVRYLGTAEQICGQDGSYLGNWVENETVAGEALRPATEAMRRAAARGYVGFAGVDVALTASGALVLDINARFNGSTPPVLFLDSIRAERGPVVARSHRLTLPAEGWEEALGSAIAAGRIVPLCISDPGSSARCAPGGRDRDGAGREPGRDRAVSLRRCPDTLLTRALLVRRQLADRRKSRSRTMSLSLIESASIHFTDEREPRVCTRSLGGIARG